MSEEMRRADLMEKSHTKGLFAHQLAPERVVMS